MWIVYGIINMQQTCLWKFAFREFCNSLGDSSVNGVHRFGMNVRLYRPRGS